MSEYYESKTHFEREQRLEVRYVIATSEKGLSVLDAVALYKELTEVESGFRQLKDVMAMRPIYHQIETRVKAHIFVAALALLVQRLLGRRLEEGIGSVAGAGHASIVHGATGHVPSG